jgi:peroxiredoxin
LAGIAQRIEEFRALGIDVVAASADPEDKAREFGATLPFPVAHGVTPDMASTLGAWWEARRGIVQPTEFVVGRDGRIVSSTYSSGPIGRVDAGDILSLVRFLEAKRAQS